MSPASNNAEVSVPSKTRAIRSTNASLPRASVIIPTWNRPKLLKRAMEALAAQTTSDPFEVLVIENGSSDARPLQSLFPTFQFYWLDARGVCAARNLGMREARSPLLIYLDDDVLASSQFVQAHIRAHTSGDKRVVIGNLDWAVDEERTCYGLSHQVAAESAEAAERGRAAIEHASTSEFRTGNFSLARELLQSVGGFDELFDPYGGEEMDLAVRLQQAGAMFTFDPSASGTHVSAATEEEYYAKTKLTGRAGARMLVKHGRDVPHVFDGFIVRSYTRERAAWERRMIQYAPRLFRAVRASCAAAAKLPGLRNGSVASVANRIRQFEACWSGVLDVVSWQELERLILNLPYTPARDAARMKTGAFDLHEATDYLAERQAKFKWVLNWAHGRRVLDLGCNDGAIAHRLQSNGAFAVGVDRYKYVRVAHDTYRVPVVAIDAEQPLPFASECFDTVVISGLLECVENPESVLREVRRILRPNGRMILIAHNQNCILEQQRRWRRLLAAEFGHTREQWQRMLSATGFSVRAIRYCPLKVKSGRFKKVYWMERLWPSRWATDYAFLCTPAADYKLESQA